MAGKESQNRFEFTIIAGSLKGRRITAPDFGITRPPLSRLRKSIFDYLAPRLDDARYLDLFSGTGSYLFEAVSRGVKQAVGVELDMRMAGAINKQAVKYNVADRLECLNSNVFTVIPNLAAQKHVFDIIMMAPPQYLGLINRTLAVLREHPILAPEGRIICQHDSKETADIDNTGFVLVQQRKYGHTTFTILTTEPQ
jgi:16S rRNA (guanine966-N2)-methyltransferase